MSAFGAGTLLPCDDAFEALRKLGLNVLQEDGVLVAASCSSRVSAAPFFEAVIRTAAAAGRPLRIMAKTTHAADHHPLGFPEGAYLKCLYGRA